MTAALRSEARPVSVVLEKRQPVLVNSDLKTIDGHAPLDAIILIGVALAFALVCMGISIWNVRYPSLRGRTVMEERARARTELRLRGAGRPVSDQGMATSNGDHKSRRGIVPSSTHSSQTMDSKTHLVTGNGVTGNEMFFQKPSNQVRPKLAHNDNSRASRGYSVYSKSDIPRRPTSNSISSMLAVPTLPAMQHTNSAGSSGSTPSSSNNSREQERLAHARPQLASRATNNSISSRISTSLGRGTNLVRHRSLERRSTEYNGNGRRVNRAPKGPRPIDASYGPEGRASPTKGPMGDFLKRSDGMTDLYRAHSDPRSSSRRNSLSSSPATYSGDASGAATPQRGSAAYFDGASSDDGGYNTPPLQHPLLPRTPPYAEQRSRPLAYYEASEGGDGHSSSAAQHFTRLLDSPQPQHNGWR